MTKKLKLPQVPSPPLKRQSFRRLPNAEYEEAVRLAKLTGIPLSQCPTCLSREEHLTTPNGGDYYGRTYGTYSIDGVEYECDCDEQINLRKHYLLANIGDQYQRLNWQRDYRDEEVKDAIQAYLDAWQTLKLQGMGLEFASPKLGVGKTFAATHVGKELIKRGERVYFLPFYEMVGVYSLPVEERRPIEQRLTDCSVLVLDEVIAPNTEAQSNLFSGKFEELIRTRTNFNRVNIMTTNLTPARLHEIYPRIYSLLSAKQFRIEMDGEDARELIVKSRNIKMVANNEVRPIT
jgi:DNA replication protein DnaC